MECLVLLLIPCPHESRLARLLGAMFHTLTGVPSISSPGYPQPEVTWYKDDEEMDRYCGLPKYQIFRHGNRHTLQLYK